MSSTATVKGWCPGALRPMASGDGLIVRLRISLGSIPVGLAQAIAGWSDQWGNGQIELSNRANLQLRGIAARDLADLHHALAERDLLDSNVAAEAVRNVICSPLAGLDPQGVLDVRPVVRALEQRLLNDTTLHALPGKFGFAVEDGGAFGLAEAPCDIRFAAIGHVAESRHIAASRPGAETCRDPAFNVVLAGAASSPLGPCRPGDVATVAASLGRAFLRLRQPGIRRMRDLVAVHGVAAIAHEAGLAPVQAARPAPRRAPYLGVHRLGGTAFVGLGLSFGGISAEHLGAIAAAAAAHGGQELRLTPWRAILLPLASIDAARTLSAALPAGSFITDPADPRCRIAACRGAPSCPQGTTPVHADAGMLMAELGAAPGSGVVLHIAGCEKGCAHPRPAALTLVARAGRYDLVRHGVASDAPALCGLTVAQAARHVRQSA